MYNIRTFVVVACTFLVLSACMGDFSSDPEVRTLSASGQLIPVDTIAIQETDEDYIGRYTGAFVTTDPFRVYIADIQRHRVAVLNREGAIQTYIGAPGQGPGELRNPHTVSVSGDTVIVNQSYGRGYAVFDTAGTFYRTDRLPEGSWSAGSTPLFPVDSTYIYPLEQVDSREQGLERSAKHTTMARLDATLNVIDTFGIFPELYHGFSHVSTERSADLVGDDRLVVGYDLTPDVQLYDISTEEYERIDIIRLEHPEFKHPEEEVTMELAGDRDDLYERMARISRVHRTYGFENRAVVQSFHNRTAAYYGRQRDKSEQEHFAIIGHLDTNQQEALSLPGPILARDDANRIYVELDPTPDQRKIGVYEVVGWDN